MKKVYCATIDFGIGEIGKSVSKGTEIEYDDKNKVLALEGMSYPVSNLKTIIK